MYLMHHVILNDHLIEWSCKFTGWSSFQHVTILISLSDHKHCDSEDIKLICHVTSHEHMFDGLLKFIGGSPSHWVPLCHVTLSHHFAMFGGHWSIASRDIKHLIYQLTSQNYVIEEPSNFMSRSSSLYVTTFSILVSIGIVTIEIYIVLRLSPDHAYICHLQTKVVGHRYGGRGDMIVSVWSRHLTKPREKSFMWLYGFPCYQVSRL